MIKCVLCLQVVQESATEIKDADAKLVQMVCSLENKEECLSCGS